MSSPFNLLNIGASGMRAAQQGVSVSSQSLTNAATPGYSRRGLEQSSVPGPPDGGNGVTVTGSRRTIDDHVERRLLGASGARGGAVAARDVLGVLDTTFSSGAGSLGDALDEFLSSLSALASRPGDEGTRRDVLAGAEALSAAFRTADSAITSARAEANARIEEGVASVNSLTTEIGALSKQIAVSEVTGQEASDLRDQRDQKIRALSELVPTHTMRGADGSLTVLMGGEPLVDADGSVHALEVDRSGAPDLGVAMRSAGALRDVTGMLTSGEIGGIIGARDGVLTVMRDKLDELAFDTANAFNAAHSAGFGLDGTSGRNLFDVGATQAGAAAAMRVSANVAGQPSRIAAASSAATVPGDNRNALALDAVGTARAVFSNTATTAEGVAALIAQAGTAAAQASQGAEAAEGAHAQAQAMRDQISGVSSDEEMTSLMKYQRAYEASLRVIQVADEMLDQLVRLGA